MAKPHQFFLERESPNTIKYSTKGGRRYSAGCVYYVSGQPYHIKEIAARLGTTVKIAGERYRYQRKKGNPITWEMLGSSVHNVNDSNGQKENNPI